MPANINIHINKNTPPTVNDKNITINNRDSYTFSSSDFTVAYNDAEGDNFGGINVTTLPNEGTLKYQGAPVTTGDLPLHVDKLSLDNGDLVYEASNNANAYDTTFRFEPCDDRGACG